MIFAAITILKKPRTSNSFCFKNGIVILFSPLGLLWLLPYLFFIELPFWFKFVVPGLKSGRSLRHCPQRLGVWLIPQLFVALEVFFNRYEAKYFSLKCCNNILNDGFDGPA